MNQTISGPHQKAQGFAQCFVVDSVSGKVVREYPRQSNLILNQGMDQVATTAWAAIFQYCSAGTGVTPTSDDSSPTTAAQSGTTVTLSGGSFVFTSTPVDAGKTIKWDSGEEATIVTVTSPTVVEVSNSATVLADDFIVYRTNQTQLATQVKRTNTYLTGSPFCGTTVASNVVKMRRTFDFTAESGLVTYTEVGLGWDAGSPTSIFSRILLAVPVPVGAGQQLRVTYELWVTVLPAASFSKTAIIGGWPVAPAATTDGMEAVQYIGLTFVSTAGTALANLEQGLGSGDPATTSGIGVFVSDDATAPASFGSSVNRSLNASYANATRAAYVAGTYYVDKSATFAVGSGNGTGIRSIGYGAHNPNVYFAYGQTVMVFVFNEAQTKLNTHTLTFTWRFAWSRVLS